MKATLRLVLFCLFFLFLSGVIFFIIYIVRSEENQVTFVQPNILAFPNAEGFGSETSGGRFGEVVLVTNLNDSGPGSLREALGKSGPRIVVFKRGGVITALSPLYITNPYITIAGQTAPGNGIVVRGSPIFIRTHDVIMRGMKMRIGDGAGTDGVDRDGITAWGDVDFEVYNVIIDHNSVAWSVDENFSTWDDSKLGNVHDLTFSWNISTEALNCSIHIDEGESTPDCHSMGFLVGEWTKKISIHHNLLASNSDRNPRLGGGTSGEFVNNVIYNWDSGNTNITSFANNGESFPSVNWDIIGNYYKETINSNEIQNAKHGINIECGTTGKVYVSGNVGWGRRLNIGDEWSVVMFACPNSSIKSRTPVASSGISFQPVMKAYEDVLNYAGSVPRDDVDLRAINTTHDGNPPSSKWLVDSPTEVGGMQDYPAGIPIIDTDNDGIPNVWEQAHGLDPNNAEDSSNFNLRAPSGYTWIEEYINSLIPSPNY